MMAGFMLAWRLPVWVVVGLAVVMEASHYCMAWRGVKDLDSKMINSVMRGAFLKNSDLRREFLALLPQKD